MKIFLYYFTLLCFIAVSALSETKVKIGVLTDLTGIGAYWGNQTNLAAEILSEELNMEESSLEIIIEDHRLQTKDAVTAVQKLIYADKVDALYVEFTPAVIAVSPILKNAKKAFIGVCAGNSFLDRNPYAFKSYIDYTSGCKQIAKYWKKKGFSKIAALRADIEYGELCIKGLKQIFPQSYIVDYNYGEDIKAQALLLKNKNIEVVLNASFPVDVMNMMKAFNEISFYPYIGTNFDAITEEIIENYSKQENQFMIFDFKEVSSNFITKIKKRDKKNSLDTFEGAALAYIHLKQLVSAIRTCNKNDVNCHMEYLSKAKGHNPNIVSFQGFDNRQAVFSLELKRWLNSKKVPLVN